jgi:hypothetical protein
MSINKTTIYEIICKDCNKSYIGYTRKKSEYFKKVLIDKLHYARFQKEPKYIKLINLKTGEMKLSKKHKLKKLTKLYFHLLYCTNFKLKRLLIIT